jgi:MFS family permease
MSLTSLSPAVVREPLVTRVFVLASLSHFLHAFAFHLYLNLSGFLHRLGASDAYTGFIFGLAAAAAILCRPVLGGVMDTRGRRVVIVTAGVIHTVVTLLYVTVGGLGPWVITVRIVHGLAEAMLFASLFAFASDIVPASRRIEGLAIFGVSGMLPMSLAGLLGDFILEYGTYRELFLVSSVLAAGGLALSLPLRDRPVPPGQAPPRGIVSAFAERQLLPIWFVGASFATALAAHFIFLRRFVDATGIGSVGLFFTAYTASAIFLRIAFGSLPERVGPKRVLFPAMLSLAIGFCMIAMAKSDLSLAIAGTLCGMGHGYTFPILLGLVVSRTRASERGAALSIFTALFDGGTLIGGPLLGHVIDWAGYKPMFASAAAIVLLSAVTFAVWDRGRPG